MFNDDFLLALDAITRPRAGAWAHDEDLFQEITYHMERSGYDPIDRNTFGWVMQRLGYVWDHDPLGRGIWRGIGLLAFDRDDQSVSASSDEEYYPDLWMTEQTSTTWEANDACPF